jgi:ELWxxDGT repeat protein
MGIPIRDPSGLAVLGTRLFFGARYGAGENELWTSQEAQRTARLVTNLRGNQPSFPSSLTVVGDKIYFTAITTLGDADLWVTDGTEAGTAMVAGAGTLGVAHGPLLELTPVGDKLFFHMQGESGDELWVSEGLNRRTAIVKEIQEEGAFGGDPVGLTAVGNVLFFMANDGVTGREPWRSDGTEDGTSRVTEFVSGSTNPSPSEELKAGPGVLVLSIYDNASGQELWSISDAGAVQLTDIIQGPENSNPHGMTMVGDKLYFAARARLSDQGQELFVLDLDEVDCINPSVTCPGDLEVEAVSSMGAFVFLPPPEQLSDDSFTPLTVSYSPASAGIFLLDNPTQITVTVTDMAGRLGTCSFFVTARDRTGPELACPDRLTVEAVDASGADVSFPVVARDAVTGVSSVSFVRESGDTGTHFDLSLDPGDEGELVTITAKDGRDNPTSCQFRVLVKDTVPPALICPGDIVDVATRQNPAPITIGYPPPVPTDAVSATLVEDPQHPSTGSPFDPGTTEVELRAVDSSGNVGTCSFLVHIVDPVAPTITCPGPQQAVATGSEGAVVDFPEAEAEDDDAPPTVSYSAEPGSTFPVGETTVTATAEDRGGNKASCSFTVTVTEPTQSSGCGCRAGSASASVYWLLLALAPLWARRRAGRLAR